MAWDEWEQLKAAVAERHATQMQLNQLPAAGGGGSSGGGVTGKVRSDKAAWSKAGKDVSDLRDNSRQALTRLKDGQTGFGKEPGCLTAAAQQGVYDSWERRIRDISELCGGLAAVLEKTGNDQLRTDEAIKGEIASLKVRSEDTPAAGSAGKGW
ncbi:hypothetical protein [Streptomyces sp. NPDC059010]|uniref:hypothetical protein n=1 Tax=Streptomyces sp. NPDC059010 TaxID=3346695 RepID=UPI0036C1BB36